MFVMQYAIFILVVFGALIGFYLKPGKTFENYLSAFVGGVVGFVVVVVILCVGNNVLPTQWSKDYTSTKLVSLRDQNSIHGSFYLGTGEISGVQTYAYYTEYGGGFKRFTLGPEHLEGSKTEVILFEEDRTDAELKVFKLEYEKEWYEFFTSPTKSHRYEFHVPKGSITRKFELN